MGAPEKIEEFLEAGPGLAPVCLAFSPRGTLLAGGCTGGELVIWDYETRSVARVLPPQGRSSANLGGGGQGGDGDGAAAPPAAITALAWSASGRRLAAGTACGRLVIWDVLAGQPLAEHDLGCGAVVALCSNRALPGALLVSCAVGPAQLLSLSAFAPGGGGGDIQRRLLPALAAAEDGRGLAELPPPGAGHSSDDSGGGGGGGVQQQQQLATLSPCGRLAYASSRGTLLVVRLADMAVLDVLKVGGPAAPLGDGIRPRRALCGWWEG